MKKNIKLNDKDMSEEGRELRNFVFILIGIVLVVLVIYGITSLIKKNKDKTEADTTVTEGEIDYDKVIVGTMLGKEDKEYYVMVYDGKDDYAILYSTIITEYKDKENSLNIYYCDLSNKLNEAYKAKENSNPSAKSVDEFAFGDLTLVKVKNGKVSKYIEGLDTIKKELGL